jgi:predicted membrane protein DUF2232
VIRTLFLLATLGLGAAATPMPWATLWVAVPLVVAISILVCWRWGLWGVIVPLAALGLVAVLAGPLASWAWWIPAASLTGSWMGLREEGGGPASGERAWMLLPVLLLAAGLPWTLSYPQMVSNLEQEMRTSDRSLLQTAREMGYQGERLHTVERVIADSVTMRQRYLPHTLPTFLFGWVALLVVAGRKLAAQLARRLKWPDLSHGRLLDWRLPDGAIWLLIAGLGLVLTGLHGWLPSAWTLLIVPALGFCVQGMAVVQSLLLVRGIPSSIVILTLLFIVLMAFPVFLPATVCVGLSDVWLDYRRLEAAYDGDLS